HLRFQNAYHASSGRRLAIDRGPSKNSLHQQPLESLSRISYFDRMKIVEQLERNDELGEPLPLREPVRPALFRRHLPALVPVAKDPRPRHTRTSQFRGLCSKLLSSRIPCKSHITKD